MRIYFLSPELIDGLRAWFHPKDRSVVMADDCFIEGDEISTPANPRTGRRRLYAKSGCWYDLDSAGTETSLCANNIIDRWGNIVSSWSFLPGLVGFWPMSPVQRSTGNAYDMSGQSRTLTYNGNPTYNIYDDFVPYIDLDGAGDFLLRADETDLDVLGTETINAAAVRGATWGGWFWGDALATYILMSKWTAAGNQRSYQMYITGAGGTITGAVSTNGIAAVTQASSNAIAAGSWFFAVTRFVPSTTLDIYVNNTKTTLAAGVPASIFNSTAGLIVGANEAGTSALLDGRATLCFLSHQIFSDALINAMFQQSRILFGV